MSVIYSAFCLKYADSDWAQRSHEQRPSPMLDVPLYASLSRHGLGRTLLAITGLGFADASTSRTQRTSYEAGMSSVSTSNVKAATP